MAKKIITADDDDRDDGPVIADDGKGKVKGKEEPYVPEFEIVDEGQERRAKDDDDDDVGADERLSAEQRDEEEEPTRAAGDETEDQRRDRRRQERKNKKERQRAAMQRDKTELNFLRTRLETLERDQSGRLSHIERRQVQSEVGVIDNRIQFLESQMAEADEILAKAIEANNGGDVVKLTNVKANITDNLRRLKDYKTRYQQAAAQADRGGGEGEEEGVEGRARTRQPEVGLSKVALGHAKRFYDRHKSWYDPNGGDEESAIVLAIDQVIEQEGFDPDTVEYWQELEKRTKRRLPSRFKNLKDDDDDDTDDDDDDDEPAIRRGNGNAQRRGPRMPAGGGGRGSPTRFVLSAERKAAMIEAGAWDDPKLRDRYISKYKEWDEQNPPSRRQ